MSKIIETKSKYKYSYALPTIVIYSVFLLIPNTVGLLLGFTDWSLFSINSIHFNGFRNFRQMGEERIVLIAIKNTIYFTIFTVVAKNILGLLFAFLADSKLKTRNYLRTITFLPMVISPIVIAVIFKAILEPEGGLLNSLLRSCGLGVLAREWLTSSQYAMTSVCISDVWAGVGFCMVIYIAGMQGIPKDVIEAATIDGASGFKRLIKVTLPLLMNSVSVNIMLSFVNGLKVFAQVYALTNGGPSDSTQVIQTLIYKAFSQGRLGYAAAISLLFTIITAFFSLMIFIPLKRREIEL